ncbi:unnamed protein product [Pylaiella littoralis]
MSRRHNPRMSTVRQEELTHGHRQCVKPDQAITIYKLRDHETNDEFLEFDEEIIFQTACLDCLNIKSCINAGHKLVDWRPTFAGGRMAGSPSPFSASDQPPASSSLRSMSPPLGGGGAGSGGAGASTGVGVAKKGRGGGTPTRSKSNRNRTFGLASVVAQEEEVSNGGADGWKGSHAGRKADVRGGAAAAAAGSKQDLAVLPKVFHKRKTPGSAATPTANNSKALASRRFSLPSPGKVLGRKRGVGRGVITPGGGVAKRVRRKSADESFVRAPKMEMEIDTDSAGMGERPHKRRGKAGNPAAVTPSPKIFQKDSFETSSAGEDQEALSGGDAAVATPEPSSPKTVAEKLKRVQSQETELLRQFEDTHKLRAQEEEAKRREMAEFQRAGELALLAIQAEKEEALRRISEERKDKAAEREKLVQERLKEFEAEEEVSRIEAREKDARLEAEKERLVEESTAADAAAAAGSDGSDGAASTDIHGKRHPGWCHTSWILSGVTSAEYMRVGVQNARRTGHTPPPKKCDYVKNEKTGAKAAAVAKLLAGAVVPSSGVGAESILERRAPAAAAGAAAAAAAAAAAGGAGGQGGSMSVKGVTAAVGGGAGGGTRKSECPLGDASNGGGLQSTRSSTAPMPSEVVGGDAADSWDSKTGTGAVVPEDTAVSDPAVAAAAASTTTVVETRQKEGPVEGVAKRNGHDVPVAATAVSDSAPSVKRFGSVRIGLILPSFEE